MTLQSIRHQAWTSPESKYRYHALPPDSEDDQKIPSVPRVTKERAVPVDRRVFVQRFSADQTLVDDRILYRERPNEVSYYEYKRWANSPVDIVTNYFVHRLKESGDFSSVSSRQGRQHNGPDPRGRLYHFEEEDRGPDLRRSHRVFPKKGRPSHDGGFFQIKGRAYPV